MISISMAILLAYLVGCVFTFIFCGVQENETGIVTFISVIWPLAAFIWVVENTSDIWSGFWRGVWSVLKFLHRYSFGTLHRLLNSEAK